VRALLAWYEVVEGKHLRAMALWYRRSRDAVSLVAASVSGVGASGACAFPQLKQSTRKATCHKHIEDE
jgi:hypothetical protein